MPYLKLTLGDYDARLSTDLLCPLLSYALSMLIEDPNLPRIPCVPLILEEGTWIKRFPGLISLWIMSFSCR